MKTIKNCGGKKKGNCGALELPNRITDKTIVCKATK